MSRATLIGAVLAFSVVGYAPGALRSQEWVPIFDGVSLEGWEHVGEGEFVLENGLLRTVGGIGILMYARDRIGPAEVRIEYRSSPGSNSGVMIRMPDRLSEVSLPLPGHEIQIAEAESPYHRTGAIYSFAPAQATPSRSDEWNEMVIRIDGPRTSVHINGTMVSEYVEGDPAPEKLGWWEPDRTPKPDRGYLGLQNYPEGPPVFFRRIEVRSIS